MVIHLPNAKDHICQDCGHMFRVIALLELIFGAVKCPKCGSRKIGRLRF